ncbi:protein let-653-like isoform X1 [Diaphorina citri]|uniref:Lysosome-associated membrane glycoprotein 5 n=1 Tax=Diaphorina citri TaxID=121845 RepID=A0A3Q0J9J9_DIACI|nr:protein let-653-like isoform X1 [Diaphorina citri]
MLRTLFFCVLIVVGGVLAKEKHKTEEASSVVPPTLPPHETTSTSTTTTTTTTTTSTTEKPTTTSTTEKPTTTSTTEKPTTTSTTEKPTTTSTVKPSTTPVPPTPSPTPQPANQVGVWNVTEVVNNKTSACIVASMAVNITVHYEKVDPKNASLQWNATQVFSVPASAKASGTCGNTSQSLILSWTIDNATLSLKFQFDQNNQSAFMLSSVLECHPSVLCASFRQGLGYLRQHFTVSNSLLDY